MNRPAPARELAIAFAVFVLLALAVSWPLARNFTTRLVGETAFDQRNTLWIFWHVEQALVGHEPWFRTDYLYYPHGVSTLINAVGPLSGIVALPFSAWGPIAAYNGTMLLGLAASGWCMYLLARRGTTLSFAASLFAGAVFMMWPIHLSGLYGHIEKVFTGLLPLSLLAGLRAYDPARARGWLAAPAAVLLVSLLHHGNQFLFAVLGLVLLAGSELVARRRAEWRPVAFRVIASGALAIAITAPLTVAMALVASDPSFFVAVGDYSSYYAPDLLQLAAPSIHQAALGPLFYPAYDEVLLDFTRRSALASLTARDGWYGSGVETAVTIPLSCLALAAVAAIARRREAGRYLLLAGIFTLLALGPRLRVAGTEVATLPYAWLMGAPGFEVMRTPGRFMMMASIGFAIAAACGWARLTEHTRLRWAAMAATLLVLIECWPRPWPQQMPLPVPAFYERIAHETEPYAVLDLPSAYLNGSFASAYEYYQLTHRKPIAWGYLSRPFMTFPVSGLDGILDPRAPDPIGTRARLADLGYRYVVWHKRHAELFESHEARENLPPVDARTNAFLARAFAGEQPIADDELVTVYRIDSHSP
jgi:hypothetical protein